MDKLEVQGHTFVPTGEHRVPGQGEWHFCNQCSAVGPLRVQMKWEDPYSHECDIYVEQVRDKIFGEGK